MAYCVVMPRPSAASPPSPSPRSYLRRPYGRVDRPKLKRRLLERSIASGVTFYRGKVRSCGALCVWGAWFDWDGMPVLLILFRQAPLTRTAAHLPPPPPYPCRPRT